MASKSNASSLKPTSKELLRLVQSLRRSVKCLKSISELDDKHANTIIAQDKYVSLLSDKNKEMLSNYEEKGSDLPVDKRLDEITEIIFRNFNILSGQQEIFKAYIDEFLGRFSEMETTLSHSLILLEKYLVNTDQSGK